MTGTFFTAETIRFLSELGDNNNRDWFNANKARYEACVREPALDFIDAMAAPMAAISAEFPPIAKKVGGSLMRVYRDTRFGNDKTPYKTNIGIQFRHSVGKDVHAPGFYVHIEPGEVFLGAGMWHPEPKALGKVRDWIVQKPERWSKVIGDKAFKRRFALSGESLKRHPRGFPPEHEHVEDLKRKDFIAICTLPESAATRKEFPDQVGKAFNDAAPLVRFLCEAIEVPY